MLFHWIDGRFLYHRLMPAHLAAVGDLTAQLHNHSVHLHVPAAFDRPRVDPADAETEEGVVRLFTDYVSAEAADVMQQVFRRVRQAQQELGSGPDTFGIIHADIHQTNYLFNGREVRLIDFGDCGWGHYIYDLAVTVHQLGALPRCAELRAALLAGYRRVRDLSPAHEALIDTFAMLREVQDLTWLPKERVDEGYEGWIAHVGKGISMLKRPGTGVQAR
jgi:Ser/Thr protein kinase RdoA (MazF antagonist)